MVDGTWGGVYQERLYERQGRLSDRLCAEAASDATPEGCRFFWCLRGSRGKGKPWQKWACDLFLVQFSTRRYQRAISETMPMLAWYNIEVFILRSRFILSHWVKSDENGTGRDVSADVAQVIREKYANFIKDAVARYDREHEGKTRTAWDIKAIEALKELDDDAIRHL
eukprot:GSA25T00017442001.1